MTQPPGYPQGPQQPPYQQQPYPQHPQGYQQPYPQQPQAYQQPYPQQPQGYHQQPVPPQARNVPHVAPPGSAYPVLVSTMNDLPGYGVDQVYGEVFGLTVRSRDLGANFVASFRSLGGGEVNEFTQMLAESRHVAVMRMCQMAQAMGANAILAMRFDCNEIAQTMSEVAAYGTAVVVSRRPDPQAGDPDEPQDTDDEPGEDPEQ